MTVSPEWPTDGNRPDLPDSEPLEHHRKANGGNPTRADHAFDAAPASGARMPGSRPAAADRPRPATAAPTLFQLPDLGRPGEHRKGISPGISAGTESFLLAGVAPATNAATASNADPASAAAAAPPQNATGPEPQSASESEPKSDPQPHSDAGDHSSSEPNSLPELDLQIKHRAEPETQLRAEATRPDEGLETTEPVSTLPSDDDLQSDSSSVLDLDFSEPASQATPPRSSHRSVASQPSSAVADAPTIPAGRIWMETIRAHGTVVALLGVVVVGAVISGRGGDDDEQSSRGRQSELAGLQEGDSLASQDLENSLAQEAFDVASPVRETPQQIDLVEAAGESPSVDFEESITVYLDSPMDVEPSAESTDLSQSFAATPDAASQNAVSQDAAAEEKLQQYSEIIPPSSGVKALAVSRQTTTEDYQSLPSLQELLEEEAAATEAKPKYRTTRTPHGLQDLLKYLPRLPGDVAEPSQEASVGSSAESYDASYFDLPLSN